MVMSGVEDAKIIEIELIASDGSGLEIEARVRHWIFWVVSGKRPRHRRVWLDIC